jgi:hypothetical protein
VQEQSPQVPLPTREGGRIILDVSKDLRVWSSNASTLGFRRFREINRCIEDGLLSDS